MGLRHEMTRPDRDSYVIIDYSNIKSGKYPQFDKQSGNAVGNFDFDSVMLYPSIISDPKFAIDTTKPCITRLDGTTYPNPQTGGLSSGDEAGIATLYPIYVQASPNVVTLVQGGDPVTLDFPTFLNSWSDHTTPVNISITGLPNGVGNLFLDTYGDNGPRLRLARPRTSPHATSTRRAARRATCLRRRQSRIAAFRSHAMAATAA
jgi:hypothetical protein